MSRKTLKQIIAGRKFEEPCVVVTKWYFRELSATSIVADEHAKIKIKRRKMYGRKDKRKIRIRDSPKGISDHTNR